MTPLPPAAPTALTAADLPELFQAYQGLVYRTAYLLLDSREEAEDALQEVFLAVYRFAGSYDPRRGAVSTWLHRLTVNHCRQRLTRPRWRWWPRLAEDTPAPNTAFEQVDETAELRTVLAQLPPDLRLLVVLRYGGDLRYQEIADILGLPVGTVKSRHTAALERLRAIYEARERAAHKRETGR